MCKGWKAAAFDNAEPPLAADLRLGRRAPRAFMISIVALYSRSRRAISACRLASKRLRSLPTSTSDVSGAAALRTASFGDFARAIARASSSVTGPSPAATLARLGLLRRTTVLRAALRAFLAFPAVFAILLSFDRGRCPKAVV